MSEPERAEKPVISERIAVGRSSQQVHEYFLDDRQGLDGHVVVGVRRMGIPLPVDAGDVKRDPRTIEVGFLVVVRVRPNRFDRRCGVDPRRQIESVN